MQNIIGTQDSERQPIQSLCINCVGCVNVDKNGKMLECEESHFKTKYSDVALYVPEMFDCEEFESRPK